MIGIYTYISAIEDTHVTCCMETGVLLFIYKYLSHENTKNPPLYFVIDTEATNKGSVTIDIADFKFTAINYDQVDHLLRNCQLPVYSLNEYYCIAGFCAVLRQIIKAFENDRWLLGFREVCLSACAEFSIWTKFCEVDLISSIKEFLVYPSAEIPKDLVRLEYHLLQPVRTHNIGKNFHQAKKNGILGENGAIEHIYVEGADMLLSDLIIFPLVHICCTVYGAENLQQYLPLTCKWYELMISQPKILSCLSTFNFSISTIELPLIVPETKKESLYKCDPKRYKPKNRVFTKQEDVDRALQIIDSTDILSLYDYDNDSILSENFTWTDVPYHAHPKGGDLPVDRLNRKMQQIENVVKSVLKIAEEKDTIVDFCCGGGHVGILLAYLLPDCFVLLLDNKEHSLWKACERISHLNLKNVYIVQSNVDYFQGKFQIGVTLHACGVATDLVINNCIQNKSKFVVAPCCYGKLQQNHILQYPKSKILIDCVSVKDYMVLGHSADQTHKEEYSKSDQGEKCMKTIDVDRCLHAQENHYRVHLAKMMPVTCSPKNNLLIGVPE